VESCRERLSLRDQEILIHLTNLRDLVMNYLYIVVPIQIAKQRGFLTVFIR